jgi:hypothetical protein
VASVIRGEARLLLGLEVVEEDAALLGFLTPVLDDNAGAVDDLAGVALTIDLACQIVSLSIHHQKKWQHLASRPSTTYLKRTETSPLAELLAVRDLDERDLVLRAERNNELLVRLLLACLVQDTHVCLTTVEGLGSLAETAGKTVMDESELENALERLKDGHLALAAGGIG